jgi:hypothetical protein
VTVGRTCEAKAVTDLAMVRPAFRRRNRNRFNDDSTGETAGVPVPEVPMADHLGALEKP